VTVLLSFIQSNKFQSFLFFLLILFLPTQLGKHFWFDWSYVVGQRIDYLSPTLYVTDILAMLFILFSFVSNRPPTSSRQGIKKRISVFEIKKVKVIFIFLFLAFGIFLSRNPFAGWYSLVKLLEFILLGFAIKDFLIKPKNLEILTYPLLIGVVFESTLALFQFFRQSSLGGIFYFFGERTFTGMTPGIANASLNGQLILRPYGTFSHPNVLAAYLVIAMTIILSMMYQVLGIRKIVTCFCFILGTGVLFFTLSRVAIILWIFILIALLFKHIYRSKTHTTFFILSTFFFVFVGMLFFFLTPLHYRFFGMHITDESFTDRIFLLQSSWQMIQAHSLFGVGFGNFLNELPFVKYHHGSVLLLQPVHNIFFLVAAETGITGLVFVLWFLYKTVKKGSQVIVHRSWLVGIVIILGMFDHYFLTIQQGQLLFMLVLAMCWTEREI
jgi:O-antigen ligase